MNKNQLFRLAAVLYADNNYEVAPKTIIRKVIESALLSNGNKPINLHELIDFIYISYNLHFDELEVKNIVLNEKEKGFLINDKNGEIIICLSEKRKQAIESKLSNRTIDYYIQVFETENLNLVTGSNSSIKEVVYRFLYEILSSNIESFKKLLDSKKKIEELINVESHSYTNVERSIINEFLAWDNNEKNKAIFDIASYALEYCMISNNGEGSHIQLNNLKNKIFYLDTNVIFRALGINGTNRQNRTKTFLSKFLEVNTTLVISKFSETEFKDTITFYLDKLKKGNFNKKVNPEIFQEKYFKSISDIYDFYYKWRAGKYNDSLELFEAYIFNLYEKFKAEFDVTTDYKIPFDPQNEKTLEKINELSESICSYKNTEGSKHGFNGDKIDALNIMLIETKRDGKNTNIFETKQFIVSTDQSLRRWDYFRNSITPVVILPSQWLSILLRYINRSDDDFKSFVSFLNLPNGDSQIDSEQLHIILGGISEMTQNFEQQRFIVQSLVQKKFDGILEKGIKDDEILERTKNFAKSELEKKVEEIDTKNKSLESEFVKHKEDTYNQIDVLRLETSEQTQKLEKSKRENKILKEQLRENYIEQKINGWKRVAYFFILLLIINILFFYFQFFYLTWNYNFVYKLIIFFENHPIEIIKQLMIVVNTTLLGTLVTLMIQIYNRLICKSKIEEKREQIIKKIPSEFI
jgi:hypothetical protein